MKENKIKNKTSAIRECIRKSVQEQNLQDFIFDINNKINRLNRNQFLVKKLLEQIYVNLNFKQNLDVNSNVGLNEFNEKFDSYK